ncbi:hypothetical protein GCM10009716_33380 [Streptomyces sodiiphilus]|uniref:MarR family transcriptional regulator n=1 Tax=Streptomyces sodiiphilus TaxID=226217 RepID=A0ABN2PLA7_9ACTN
MNTHSNETGPPQGWQREDGSLKWRHWEGPWKIEITCMEGGPFNGPTDLSISLHVAGDDETLVRLTEEAISTNGIPASLLRQVPLAEIKAQARAILAPQEGKDMHTPWPVPERCRTDTDYALLVAELARMRATGSTAPQGDLAARLGIGKATMSERIKRAKDRGLWDGRQLTDKARQILNQWKDQ